MKELSTASEMNGKQRVIVTWRPIQLFQHHPPMEHMRNEKTANTTKRRPKPLLKWAFKERRSVSGEVC